jgi:hypothetical protein
MNYAVIAASIKKTIIGRKTKSIIAALLLAASGAFAQVPSYVPTNGLVGWWPFNGNANDESGNGNNGTVNGATLTESRFGVINSAYLFNGTSDYIQCNDAGLPSGTTSYSFNAWILLNQPANNSWSTILGYGTNNNTNNDNGKSSQFWITNNSNPTQLLSNDFRNRANRGTIDSINYRGTWHMITFIKPNADSLGLWYFDGSSIPTGDQNIGGTIRNITLSGILRIGKSLINVSPYQYYWNGKLDDIGIWNRALTQQEITALYNAQACSGTGAITADGPTTFCAGNYVYLTSDVNGGTYQWKKNGVNISTNSTSRTFKATSTGSYTCVATCNGTTLTSNAIQVTSKTNASASVSASGATSFCLGDSVALNCTNLGSNYSVQWYRTNISMENATAYSQVVKQPGTYKVVTKNLTNGCSRISGSSVVVAVNCRIAGDITSGTSTPLTESEAKFTANELSQGVNIFPNPNSGSFTFAYDGEEYGDAVLQVINSMGQMIYNTNVTVSEGGYTQDVQLGDNSSKGIYIVRLLINGNSYDSRVLVR